MTIQENVPLAPFTTLKVGGPAKYFCVVDSTSQLSLALDFASKENLPILLIGGGSNIVISDKGWDGLVIKIELKGIQIVSENESKITVNVGAGENWDDFVSWSVKNDLSGIECLSGIPGTTGSTPIQNVGAYGQEVSETIHRVQVLDVETKETRWIINSDCHFSYRNNIFKKNGFGKLIVISVDFELQQNVFPELRYGELKREVEDSNISDLPSLRNKVLEIRRRKSMVVDKSDPNSRSAGSFFTNPIVSAVEFDRFLEIAREMEMEIASIPQYPQEDGKVKLAAGWLIEQSGFEKGFVFGNVGLSNKHALAIINRENGSALEIFNFAKEIQDAVKMKWGIWLENEPQFIGDFD